MPLTTRQLAEQSGATYRQIDYWCRVGVISAIGDSQPGSGFRRMFTEETMLKTAVLVEVYEALGDITTKLMRQILEHYEDGVLDFGNGVKLTWE